MKKDKAWAKEQLEYYIKAVGDPFNNRTHAMINAYKNVEHIIDQLDEPETLSQEWIDENKVARIDNLRKMTTSDVVTVEKIKSLLVPKQEEVDKAYKDGYEEGKKYTFYKGYLEGLADKESEPETVADVLIDFMRSGERLKKVLSMEVGEVTE